jgi:alpha/beta superfamily hydrolase
VLVALGLALIVLPSRRLVGQTPVSLTASDGGVVQGDLYGAGARGIVLAPGARFERGSWAPQASVIADADFRVLAIDYRGRGGSGGGSEARNGERLDVLAAVRYLREQGLESVSVLGASFGGGAAARAAIDAAPGEIDRLILLAAVTVEHPERIHAGRTLFVVARGDTLGSGVPRLVGIRKQYEAAPDPKRLLVLDGSAHAQYLFRTDQGPRLLDAIIAFLREP